MKLSKTIRKNPTQTTTLQNEYARALRRLFITYRKSAIEAFYELVDTRAELSTISELAAADVDIITLDKTLRQLGVQLVTSGQEITEQQSLKSYTSGTKFGSMALKRVGVEAVIGVGPADWRVIDALKVRNLSALRGITDEMNKQIVRELTDGINLGESIPKLRNRLAGRIDHIGKTRATVMARTETIEAFSRGTELRYAQAGIKEMEWLTAQDERVCEFCGPLDGDVFSIKSNHPRPPLHPQCRCALLPVVE